MSKADHCFSLIFFKVKIFNFYMINIVTLPAFRYVRIMKQKLIFITSFTIAVCLNVTGYTQECIKVTWKQLADVTFYEKYNEEYDINILYPKFGNSVQKLDGQLIEIEGYAIPIEELGYQDILVLSALPYSMCFFCGMAGPESVMDIKPKKKMKKIKLDSKLKFRGKLKLNETDLSQLNYVLLDAELVK
mgnify:CR=1 FL=1